jgi:hypothetical protein
MVGKNRQTCVGESEHPDAAEGGVRDDCVDWDKKLDQTSEKEEDRYAEERGNWRDSSC